MFGRRLQSAGVRACVRARARVRVYLSPSCVRGAWTPCLYPLGMHACMHHAVRVVGLLVG